MCLIFWWQGTAISDELVSFNQINSVSYMKTLGSIILYQYVESYTEVQNVHQGPITHEELLIIMRVG